MPNSVRQLSIGQRFQLGILCEEFDQSVATGYPRPPADESERRAVVTGTARIVRYLSDHDLHCDQFTDEDKEDYRQAFFAAVLLRHPHDYDSGTLAYDILAAAGLIRPMIPQ